MTDKEIRKDIFVAVISSGSVHQKENWKRTCEEAKKWVFGVGDSVKEPIKKTK